MESYAAVKKNEIVLSVTICMDLEIAILSEVSQTKINVILTYI